MDPAVLELLKASPAVALAIFVLIALRDQTTLLRSMDRRLAKVLENARALTPPMGVSTHFSRARTRADSDDPPVAIARTNSEEDIGTGG